MNQCPICGGELQARSVTYPQEYGESIVILENVPAEVCRQCGEVLLRPEVLEKVQEVVWSGTTPKRMASIPVYDLAQVA